MNTVLLIDSIIAVMDLAERLAAASSTPPTVEYLDIRSQLREELVAQALAAPQRRDMMVEDNNPMSGSGG